MADGRRAIPSVDRLLSSDTFMPLLGDWPRALVVSTLQVELSMVRSQIAAGDETGVDERILAARVSSSLDRLAGGSLVPVINATGVVLHTNLGRAPLARAALDAIALTAQGYSNLEYDLDGGRRGSRYAHCRELLCALTGAADALVVNNNAAALVLALNTVARGLEVIVSRGELVEIGGAFRVPEIMARSSARLREVGATNRTHASDYRTALGPDTGALLKVHLSNFAMSGYTTDAGLDELASVAHDGGVPLIHDIGSGLLADPARLGIAGEPTPEASLRDGADVITMSGDKLLGGPQCGIILGRADLLDRMRRNPLCRALRVDKLTLAALSATLRLYLDPARALREIPVLRMLSLDASAIEPRATAFADRCNAAGVAARVVAGQSAVGGGAAASASLPTFLVLIGGDAAAARDIERRLRSSARPVVIRIVEDRAAIDLRTVDPADDDLLLRAILDVAAA